MKKEKNIIFYLVLLTVLSPTISLFLTSIGMHFIVNTMYVFVALIGLVQLINIQYTKNQIVLVSLFTVFVLVYLLSFFHSSSGFRVNKAFLLIICFLFLFLGRYFSERYAPKDFFRLWFYGALIFNLVLLVLLIPFLRENAISSGIAHTLFRKKYEGILVPDYLTIAYFSYPALFYAFYLGNKKERFFSVIILAIQFLFAARGPFLFLFLIIFYNEIFVKLRKFKIKYIILFSIVIIAGLYFANDIPVIARLLNGDISSRTFQYEAAQKKIMENPIWGNGLNETGLVLFGNDVDISYPHNVFLETLLEGGVLSFLPLFILYVFFAVFFIKNRGRKDEQGYNILLYVIIFQMMNSMKSNSIVELRVMFFLMGYYIFSMPIFGIIDKSNYEINKSLL